MIMNNSKLKKNIYKFGTVGDCYIGNACNS